MTTSENIETNADLILWCVHVLGPDDLHAAPCHSAAVIQAREMNKALHGRNASGEPILCFAHAAPWPHSKDAHAEDLKNWLKVEGKESPPTHNAEGKRIDGYGDPAKGEYNAFLADDGSDIPCD